MAARGAIAGNRQASFAATIDSLESIVNAQREDSSEGRREYFDALRAAFRLYADTVAKGAPNIEQGASPVDVILAERLRALAASCLDQTGGEPEWPARSLRDYDDARYGPYLGVSGEGSAAPAIRDAALASPKVAALGLKDPLEVGVAHDAERLGSIGELPVGPDEYRDIRLSGVGRILTSTNVGARVNVRYYGQIKPVWINLAPVAEMVATAQESVRQRLAPFVAGPNGQPRPATVYLRFRGEVAPADRSTVLRTVVDDIKTGAIGLGSHHRVGLLAGVQRGNAGVQQAIEAFDLAIARGVTTVALDGSVRQDAERLVSLPGLLNYFNRRDVLKLREEADKRGIELVAANVVDTESAARAVWSSLLAARNMGLAVGKYGLFPLSFEESEDVVRTVQTWFATWTAAPVFYVDQPTVSDRQGSEGRKLTDLVTEWLGMVGRHGVRVVLIDTVEKSRGLHLLKTEPRDRRGILTQDQVRTLDEVSRESNVRVLWAGGITPAQAFKFGQLGVFGIYVTTAVAAAIPVTREHQDDPGLANERLPTLAGVSRVKLLLEAGFLSARLAGSPMSQQLDDLARKVLEAPPGRGAESSADRELWDTCVQAWGQSQAIAVRPGRRPRPIEHDRPRSDRVATGPTRPRPNRRSPP
jgi:hypothetical protein